MRSFILSSVSIVAVAAAYAQTATVITPGKGTLTDAAGNTWLITSNGSIKEGDQWTPGGGGTSALTIVADGKVYGQDDKTHEWFTLSGGAYWVSSPAPTNLAGPATITTPASPVTTPASPSTPTPTPCNLTAVDGFGILDGVIYGPDQKPFIAGGIGIIHGYGDPTAAAVQAAFPHTNFIRLAIYNYDSPASLQAEITDFTSHGMVVELENHNNGAGNAGGSVGSVFTGQALATESSWYASVAKAFLGNPYVWWGTNNEPAGSGSALSNWQNATYQAIRGVGNNAPVMIEVNGWADTASFGSANDKTISGKWDNVVADIHMYGWLTKYDTNQSTNDSFVTTAIVTTQKNVITAGLKIPVIIGEYGDSTTGQAIDPNGMQMVRAVGKSGGAGTVAWAWGPGNPGDGLTNGNGYGAEVAKTIAATATPLAPVGTASGANAVACPAQPTTPTTVSLKTTPPTTVPDPAAPLVDPTTPPPDPTTPTTIQQQITAVQQQIDALTQQTATDATIAQTIQRLNAIPNIK